MQGFLIELPGEFSGGTPGKNPNGSSAEAQEEASY